MAVSSFHDLIVWQRAMQLVELMYDVTSSFPATERFGLADQMRRSAVSIPVNIAEGYHRSTRREYRQFLFHAYGSGAELETELELALRLKYINRDEHKKLFIPLDEVLRMLNALIKKLTVSPSTPYAPEPTP